MPKVRDSTERIYYTGMERPQYLTLKFFSIQDLERPERPVIFRMRLAQDYLGKGGILVVISEIPTASLL